MEQQLLESVIEIVPDTMDDVLGKIQAILSTNSVEEEAILVNIVKSLFYGLWNFDKMINQHNLNTKIAELLVKIPKKNSLLFFKAMIVHLHEKWNFIDHHRINKFMQLVRYLLLQAFKMCEKYRVSRNKVEKILLQKVYSFIDERSGMVYHVTDIYFEICEQSLPQGVTLDNLKMFQQIVCTHPNENIRLYIIEHIFDKYKETIARKYEGEEDLTKLEEELNQFSRHFLELAKNESKQLHRKNLYTMVGYAKSTQFSFSLYMIEKKQKQQKEDEKRKKKMSKSKKEEVKQLKKKRKEKKGKKISKIMSVRKFEDKHLMKKGAEEL